MKFRVLVAGMFSLLTTAGLALAADLSLEEFQSRYSAPAVSGINGKLEFGYLSVNTTTPAGNTDADGEFVRGALTLPVGQQFGFQLDAGVSELDGSRFTGIGGHFFWRNPNTALIGIYAHHIDLGELNSQTTRVGAELEWYHKNASLELFAGLDTLESSFGRNDFFAGEAVAAFYPNENLRLSAGVRRTFDETRGLAGIEYLPDTSSGIAPSLFAKAEFGSGDTTVSAGIKIYLGKETKSLIRRHREDDPQIRLDVAAGSAAKCLDTVESEALGGEMIVNNLKTFTVQPLAQVKLPSAINARCRWLQCPTNFRPCIRNQLIFEPVSGGSLSGLRII